MAAPFDSDSERPAAACCIRMPSSIAASALRLGSTPTSTRAPGGRNGLSLAAPKPAGSSTYATCFPRRTLAAASSAVAMGTTDTPPAPERRVAKARDPSLPSSSTSTTLGPARPSGGPAKITPKKIAMRRGNPRVKKRSPLLRISSRRSFPARASTARTSSPWLARQAARFRSIWPECLWTCSAYRASQSSAEYRPCSECRPILLHAEAGSRRRSAVVFARTAVTVSRATSTGWEW